MVKARRFYFHKTMTRCRVQLLRCGAKVLPISVICAKKMAFPTLTESDFCLLQVPADGVLIEGHSLTIDESSMTGESDPVHISEKHPFLISGCKVMDGFGSFLVRRTPEAKGN
jgi:magnesium-transporting ATPase (P-type)